MSIAFVYSQVLADNYFKAQTYVRHNAEIDCQLFK